jgi:Coatomer WD associated region
VRVSHGRCQVIWSGTGDLVAIASSDSFYILRFDREAYASRVEAGAEIGDEGVEEAFEVVAEISEVFVTTHSSWTHRSPARFPVSKPRSGLAIASCIPTPQTD